MNRGMTRLVTIAAAVGTVAMVSAGPAAADGRGLNPYGGPKGPDTVWGVVGCQQGWFFPVAARSVRVTGDRGTDLTLAPDPVFGTFNFNTDVDDTSPETYHLAATCELAGIGRYEAEYDTAPVRQDNNYLHYVGGFYSYPPDR